MRGQLQNPDLHRQTAAIPSYHWRLAGSFRSRKDHYICIPVSHSRVVLGRAYPSPKNFMISLDLGNDRGSGLPPPSLSSTSTGFAQLFPHLVVPGEWAPFKPLPLLLSITTSAITGSSLATQVFVDMCYQLAEHYAACRCLYYQHAVDRCIGYGRPGHSILKRTILVGYCCFEHEQQRDLLPSAPQKPDLY
jgi:hypothetical protein